MTRTDNTSKELAIAGYVQKLINLKSIADEQELEAQLDELLAKMYKGQVALEVITEVKSGTWPDIDPRIVSALVRKDNEKLRAALQDQPPSYPNIPKNKPHPFGRPS